MNRTRAVIFIICFAWLGALLAWASFAPGLAAAPRQQASETATPTPTATAGGSTTPTLTPGTLTPAPTGTPSESQTASPSPTLTSSSPTPTSQAPLFPTFTSAPFETPTEIFLETETPSGPPSETPTLIPFPTVTFQYPEESTTGSLLTIQHQPGSPDLPKESTAALWAGRLLRLWPLALLALVWLMIALWFLIAQRFAEA